MALSLFIFGEAVTDRGPTRSAFSGRPFFQRVSEVAGVAEACQRLQESSFDVAVVDLDADGGTEFLRNIREDPRHLHIPVVGLSRECPGPRVERLLAGGLDSVVIKPFEPSVLQNELRHIVRPAPGRADR